MVCPLREYNQKTLAWSLPWAFVDFLDCSLLALVLLLVLDLACDFLDLIKLIMSWLDPMLIMVAWLCPTLVAMVTWPEAVEGDEGYLVEG